MVRPCRNEGVVEGEGDGMNWRMAVRSLLPQPKRVRKQPPLPAIKVCTKCKKTLPVTEFYVLLLEGLEKLSCNCKPCRRILVRKSMAKARARK